MLSTMDANRICNTLNENRIGDILAALQKSEHVVIYVRPKTVRSKRRRSMSFDHISDDGEFTDSDIDDAAHDDPDDDDAFDSWDHVMNDDLVQDAHLNTASKTENINPGRKRKTRNLTDVINFGVGTRIPYKNIGRTSINSEEKDKHQKEMWTEDELQSLMSLDGKTWIEAKEYITANGSKFKSRSVEVVFRKVDQILASGKKTESTTLTKTPLILKKSGSSHHYEIALSSQTSDAICKNLCASGTFSKGGAVSDTSCARDTVEDTKNSVRTQALTLTLTLTEALTPIRKPKLK
jgi:hypothetical protein